MRRMAVAMAWVALGAAGVAGAEPQAGAYAGYTLGGDVETPALAYGLLGGVDLNENFGLQLSVGRGSDELSNSIGTNDLSAAQWTALNTLGYGAHVASMSNETVDATTSITATDIRLSALGRLPIGEAAVLYAGAGVGYYLFDADMDINLGAFERVLEGAWARNVDVTMAYDVEIENALGYHVILGASYALAEAWRLFAEFQCSMLTLKRTSTFKSATVTVEGMGTTTFDAAGLQATLDAALPPGTLDVDAPIETEEDYSQGMVRVGAVYEF